MAGLLLMPACSSGPAGPPSAAGTGEGSCSGPRWPVKILADRAADVVDLTRPQQVTVEQLRALQPVPSTKREARRRGIETKSVRMTAELVSGRLSPDGDLAVVVSALGKRKDTMIVEFPSARCLGTTLSTVRERLITARARIDVGCGSIGTAKTGLRGTVQLAGVEFVDTPHALKQGRNARGAAQNEVEVHPVTDVESLTCRQTGHFTGAAGDG
jgi:hypothetical protein